jgi:hypothetical protein
MALNAQLYELILEQIRNPLEKAVDDALSTSRQNGVTPFLRLEAYLGYGDIGASRSAQNEAQRISLVSLVSVRHPSRLERCCCRQCRRSVADYIP